MNASPGFRLQEIGDAIVGRLVAGTGRIPIVLIVGETLAAQTYERVLQGFRDSGLTVGTRQPDRVAVGDRLMAGANPFVQSSETVLGHQDVEAAVLLATPAEITAGGLPFDRCDVMILADGFPEEQSQSTQALKRLVAMTSDHALTLMVSDSGVLARLKIVGPDDKAANISRHAADATRLAQACLDALENGPWAQLFGSRSGPI